MTRAANSNLPESPPQPKLPTQIEPSWTLRLMPKPAPSTPPPVTGDFGVPSLPAAGLPSGFSTMTLMAEVDMPWIALLLIQA